MNWRHHAGSRQQTIVADPPKIATSPGPYRRRPLPSVLFSDALLRKSRSKTKLVFLPNITGQAPIVELPSVLFLLPSSETKLEFPAQYQNLVGPLLANGLACNHAFAQSYRLRLNLQSLEPVHKTHSKEIWCHFSSILASESWRLHLNQCQKAISASCVVSWVWSGFYPREGGLLAVTITVKANPCPFQDTNFPVFPRYKNLLRQNFLLFKVSETKFSETKLSGTKNFLWKVGFQCALHVDLIGYRKTKTLCYKNFLKLKLSGIKTFLWKGGL